MPANEWFGAILWPRRRFGDCEHHGLRTAYRSVFCGIESGMTSSTTFFFSDFLHRLESMIDAGSIIGDAEMQAFFSGLRSTADDGGVPPALPSLVALLKARQAMLVSAATTERVADELRRYQKFAKPGQPSTHIVQLRQQQASARQASSQSRQRFNQTTTVFLRDAGLAIPPRLSLEAFLIRWIDLNVPANRSGD